MRVQKDCPPPGSSVEVTPDHSQNIRLVAFDIGRGPWTSERAALQRQLLLEAADFLEFLEVSVLDEMEHLIAQLREARDGRSKGAPGVDDVSASGIEVVTPSG